MRATIDEHTIITTATPPSYRGLRGVLAFSERGQFSFDFGIKGGIIEIDRDDIEIKGSDRA